MIPINKLSGILSQSGTVIIPPTLLQPPIALGAYRSTQQWLFSDVTPTATPLGLEDNTTATPPRAGLEPSRGYIWGSYGPGHYFVEAKSSWTWANPGGDWINASGTPQATTNPHFSFTTNSVTTGAAAYTTNITAGVQASQSGNRWNAYIVRGAGSERAIASRHHPTLPAPSIAVTYTDATTVTLSCVACTRMTLGTAYTQTGKSETILGAVALEFERPTKTVASATLTINITQHTASAATANGYLANPPVSAGTVVNGVAAAYPGDAGLSAGAGVLVSHRYVDGSALSNWLVPDTSINVFNRANWDPEVLGLGAADTTKLPTTFGGTALAGKWIYKIPTTNISLVNSSYSGEGFAPLSTGNGALRIVTPGVGATSADGASFGPVGSLGSDLWLLFGKSICGTDAVKRTFTRFYVRFADNNTTLANTKMFREGASYANYATQQGKWGIGVHHWTSRGGNNINGGGGLGWTNRLGYTVAPKDLPISGIIPEVHSLDMFPDRHNMPWTDGFGGALYPNRWYCIEIECNLNTINLAGGSPSDGEMRVWVDGRLVMTNTGWKYRDGPLSAPGTGTDLPPFRQMGPIGMAMNFYNGGRLPADKDTVAFIDGVVCGTSYIGPMAPAVSTPTSSAPAWVTSLPTNTWTLLPNTGFAAWVNGGGIVDTGYKGTNWVNGIMTSFSAPAYDTAGDAAYLFGGGHTASSYNGVIKFNYRTLAYSIAVSASPPSAYPPIYASGIGNGLVYPSGAVSTFFRSDLTDPVDIPYNAPENAPGASHAYGNLTYWLKSGIPTISIDYLNVADASLVAGKWQYVDFNVYSTQFGALGLNNIQLQQGTKSYHDSVTGRRFVTATPGDSAVNARNHILEIDPNTHTIIAVYGGLVNLSNGVNMCQVGRKLWYFPKVGRYSSLTMMQALTFDMDTHAQAVYTITGAAIGPFYDGENAQEGVPACDAGNGNIYRWHHGADRNSMHILNTTPVSGAGTVANPYMIAQTRVGLNTPGMPSPSIFQYKLQYIQKWGVFIAVHQPTSGWYALKLSP